MQRLYYNEKHELTHTQDASEKWQLELIGSEKIDTMKETTKSTQFALEPISTNKNINSNSTELRMHFITNINEELALQVTYDHSPIYKKVGVIYAAIVLCGLYVMIIWEIVNRTFAAIIASTLSIGILAALNSRPTMTTIMGWIDVETLLLLFGMMILVAILSETGVFDYLAVYAYKVYIYIHRYIILINYFTTTDFSFRLQTVTFGH